MRKKIKKILSSLFILSLLCDTTYAYVEAYFSPNKENEVVVHKFIKRCTESVDIAAYSLTNQMIADAIVIAENEGCQVRVIMDRQQSSGKSSLDEFLIENGITVKIDSEKGIMHNKYIILDNTELLTGSFNFTNNAVKNNRENFIITNDQDLIKAFKENFEDMWSKN